MLVSEQIYLDHCFEFGCTGQRDVAAEKYSGGCILFCTERQVDAVLVGFLRSASQVYLADSDSDSDAFIWSYCRPRRPLLRPNLVAVAEATWKKIKYTVYMYVKIIVIIKSIS